jgi:anti-sigma regulatory factor (Ser/Thr protein kinase)
MSKSMNQTQISKMQECYRAAVEEWMTTIRAEEALALAAPTLSEVDLWEGAHFSEETARNKAKAAKKEYEDAIRLKEFAF